MNRPARRSPRLAVLVLPLLVLAAAFLGAGLRAGAQAPADAAAPIRVTPGRPAPGDVVIAEVEGFAPGADVEVFVDGSRSATTRADAAGRAIAEIRLDDDDDDPLHVVLVGADVGGVRRASSGVIESAWSEPWTEGDREGAAGAAFVLVAIAGLLVGSALVIYAHHRRITDELMEDAPC